jgi:hypothetical protein
MTPNYENTIIEKKIMSPIFCYNLPKKLALGFVKLKINSFELFQV